MAWWIECDRCGVKQSIAGSQTVREYLGFALVSGPLPEGWSGELRKHTWCPNCTEAREYEARRV